jgi:hypothetical protein
MRNSRYSKFRKYKNSSPIFKEECIQKGYDFEKYVVSKFDRNYFTLIEWRSDKEHDGVYPLNSLLPDMEWEYADSSHVIPFAVECKWRSNFINREIEWAYPEQLKRYREYQDDECIQVYIIIGIGGEPINPGQVFIIPLEEISNSILYANSLNDYKKHDPQEMFFLKRKSLILT